VRCLQCGFGNPTDKEFCANCGTKLESPSSTTTSAAVCPLCNSQLSPGAYFCNHCGAELTRVCPKCDSEVAPGTLFCHKCGEKLINTCPECSSKLSLEARFCKQCGFRFINLCPQCGSQVIPGTQFCNQCGQDLTKADIRYVVVRAEMANVCPQCGSQVTPETQFCKQCGLDLTKEDVKQVIDAASHVKRALPMPSALAVAMGAVLMLVSLAVPWYAVRLGGFSVEFSASDLITGTANSWTTWGGLALPIILMIAFASIALLSVVYSLWAGAATRALWAFLGGLSALCVLFSAFYFLWWVWDNPSYSEWVNIAHVGSALAFISALMMILSAIAAKGRPGDSVAPTDA
jgi:predicted amidophosphoribosyltransferase